MAGMSIIKYFKIKIMTKKINGANITDAEKKKEEDLFNLRAQLHVQIMKQCLGREPNRNDVERFEINKYPDQNKVEFLFDGNAIGEIAEMAVKDENGEETAHIKFLPYKKK